MARAIAGLRRRWPSARALAQLFDAAAITIWQLNPTEQTLTRLSSVGPGSGVNSRRILALYEDPLAQRVLVQGQASVVTRQMSASLLARQGVAPDDEPTSCLMALPLQAGAA